MKSRTGLPLVTLLLSSLLGCASVEEAPSVPEPPPEINRKIAQEAPETSREDTQPEAPERPSPEELIPGDMTLVTEEGETVARRGDFDGDGRADIAYLAVSGESGPLDLLGSEERLYRTEETGSRHSRLLLRLASGEDLLLNPGDFVLLAEFSTLPLTVESGEPNAAAGAPEVEGDLVYLRFEDREQQRHILFSVDPLYGTPHRYLFLTDSVTGFLVRDVDGDRRSEVVHVETNVTAGGFEESFYTLYQFRRRELERTARVPVVERTNELFGEVRRLLIAGEREVLLRRHAIGASQEIDRYFEPVQGMPLSLLRGVEFVYVPDLRSNPFNLAQKEPELETEILVLAEGEEQLYTVRVGFFVEPRTGPILRLLPLRASD